MLGRNVLSAAVCLLVCSSTFAQTPDDLSSTWKPVEAALGRPGQLQPGEVYKFALPRKDMKIVKDGVTVAPGLALGSWLAFKKMGSDAMVMGDLVLSEEEIEPVMLKLQQEKIEQSSIHNHLLGESPRVIYMHIEGHGDPVVLARSLAAAIALTKTPAARSRNTRDHTSSLSISTPRRSNKLWVTPEKSTEASCNSPFHEQKRSQKEQWRFRLLWAWLLPSTFSQQAKARPQSLEIMSCLPMRSIQ